MRRIARSPTAANFSFPLLHTLASCHLNFVIDPGGDPVRHDRVGPSGQQAFVRFYPQQTGGCSSECCHFGGHIVRVWLHDEKVRKTRTGEDGTGRDGFCAWERARLRLTLFLAFYAHNCSSQGIAQSACSYRVAFARESGTQHSNRQYSQYIPPLCGLWGQAQQRQQQQEGNPLITTVQQPPPRPVHRSLAKMLPAPAPVAGCLCLGYA